MSCDANSFYISFFFLFFSFFQKQPNTPQPRLLAFYRLTSPKFVNSGQSSMKGAVHAPSLLSPSVYWQFWIELTFYLYFNLTALLAENVEKRSFLLFPNSPWQRITNLKRCGECFPSAAHYLLIGDRAVRFLRTWMKNKKKKRSFCLVTLLWRNLHNHLERQFLNKYIDFLIINFPECVPQHPVADHFTTSQHVLFFTCLY